MKRFLPLLLLLALPAIAFSGVSVTGSVKTAAGAAPVLAHVHLLRQNSMKPVESVEVGRDGRYTLTIPSDGVWNVQFTAVDHEGYTVPLVINQGMANIALDATLAQLQFNRKPDTVWIIGDWNDFNFQSAEPMTRGKDGRFTFQAPAKGGELHYQLIGIATTDGDGMRSVNAPNSAGYVYDGGGDYRSIMVVKKGKKGKVTITFDPATLPTENTTAAKATFGPESRAQERMAELGRLAKKDYRTMMMAMMKAHQEGKEQPKPLSLSLESMKTLPEEMRTNGDATVRQFAAVTLTQFLIGDADSALATEILATAPATSAIWGVNPYGVARVARGIDGKGAPTTAMKFIETSPDREIQAVVLSSLVSDAFHANRETELRTLYAQLKQNYGDLESTEYSLTEYNPDAAIRVGKMIPDFEVTLLTGEKVSRQSMMGKTYMIDFWATWCGPCVAEMPSLHAAWEKYHGKNGFTVLSLSFDGKVGDIAPFREKKWKMPWLHTFVEKGFKNDLSKRFEVMGIPKPILVGSDGTIIATESDLRGSDLDATLAKHLEKGQAMN